MMPIQTHSEAVADRHHSAACANHDAQLDAAYEAGQAQAESIERHAARFVEALADHHTEPGWLYCWGAKADTTAADVAWELADDSPGFDRIAAVLSAAASGDALRIKLAVAAMADAYARSVVVGGVEFGK